MVAALMDEAEHDMLGHMAFPKEHRPQMGALLLAQNDAWAIQRRHMSLETLAGLGENRVTRLAAITA